VKQVLIALLACGLAFGAEKEKRATVVGTAAAAGAAIGAAVAKENRVKGAIIGGAVGGAAGMLIDHLMSKRKAAAPQPAEAK
jgi:uncharacterized membrane protein YccC